MWFIRELHTFLSFLPFKPFVTFFSHFMKPPWSLFLCLSWKCLWAHTVLSPTCLRLICKILHNDLSLSTPPTLLLPTSHSLQTWTPSCFLILLHDPPFVCFNFSACPFSIYLNPSSFYYISSCKVSPWSFLCCCVFFFYWLSRIWRR